MRRHLFLGSLVLAVGCGQTGLNTPSDGGTGGDLSVPPGSDLSMTTPGPDMATTAVAGTLVTAGTFSLNGLTSDDQFAIAQDTAHMGALVGVPLAGGMPVSIDKAPDAILIRGRVVFTWDQVDQATFVGGGNAWQNGTLHQIGNASTAGIADASPDGTWVFYTDNADANGDTVDLVVSHADGTGPLTFAKGVVLTQNCFPDGRFGANGKLVVSYCDAPTDAGTTGANLVVVDPASGQPTSLATGMANWFELDSTGTKVLSADASDKGSIFSTTGAAAIAIDADVQEGFFLPDGSAVIYRTSTSELKQSDGASPPISLATNANVLPHWFVSLEDGQRLPPVSPDGKWVIFSNVFDGQQGTGDLSLVKTGAAGNTPTTLVSNVAGALFGDPFTSDSSRAIFYSTVVTSGAGLIGTLNTVPVTGGTPTQNAKRVWESFAGNGTTVFFNDNYKPGRGEGRADLQVVDVAKTDAPRMLAPQAEASFFLTKGKDKVIFSMTTANTKVGIYSAPAN